MMRENEASSYDCWADWYDLTMGDRTSYIAFYSSLLTSTSRGVIDVMHHGSGPWTHWTQGCGSIDLRIVLGVYLYCVAALTVALGHVWSAPVVNSGP